MQLSEARQFFEEMGCSHFHMSREYPAKYAEYRALRIAPDEEKTWRGERMRFVAAELTSAASPDWQPLTRLIDLCANQGDVESLKSLEHTIDSVAEKLPPKGSLIVAESLIGTAAYHYESGPIHLAVKLKQQPIARRLVEAALRFAARAKAAQLDPLRTEATIKKCAAVRDHFKL